MNNMDMLLKQHLPERVYRLSDLVQIEGIKPVNVIVIYILLQDVQLFGVE